MSSSTSSRRVWAKLIPFDPEKSDISLLSESETVREHVVPGKWMMKQHENGEIWITNLSESLLKVDDDSLEKDEAKQISGGERITFEKEEKRGRKKKSQPPFDYLVSLMNIPIRNDLKREREKSLESSSIRSAKVDEKTAKFCKGLLTEWICSICLESYEGCVTVAPCLHSFCSTCIFTHFKKSINCPLCRTQCQSVTPNLLVQKALESRKKSEPQDGPLEKHLKGKIINDPRGVYIGDDHNGIMHGYGIMIFKDGVLYEGLWANHTRHGEGKLTVEDSSAKWKYKGTWANDLLLPHVEMFRNNVLVYTGETFNLVMYGRGKYFFSNGDTYDGQFVNGARCGFGVYSNQSGYKYSGSWWGDKKHGNGREETNDGEIYNGQFKDGKREGKGILQVGQRVFYDGYWVNGLKNGRGKYCYLNGDEYEGEWKDDFRDGPGVMKYRNGDHFEGEWKDGFRIGFGMMKYKNGDSYKGNWDVNLREGEGVYTLKNGDRYEGRWKNDKMQPKVRITYVNKDEYVGEVDVKSLQRNGKGVLSLVNGNKYDGSWLNDEQHGHGTYTWAKKKSVYEGTWENGIMSGGILTEGDGTKHEISKKKIDTNNSNKRSRRRSNSVS